jgi:hypothetical protein
MVVLLLCLSLQDRHFSLLFRLLWGACFVRVLFRWVLLVLKYFMAVGQLKGLALRTYGVGLESGARSSPDSSGSPQRRVEVAAN